MRRISLVLSAALFASSFAACAAESRTDEPSASADISIDTKAELDTFLAAGKASPLDKLSPLARQRFVESLVFSDGGLGSYGYADLEAELTASEIHSVLAMFGVEGTTSMITGAKIKTSADEQIMLRPPPGADHDGYRCESRATCVTATFSICTSNC